VNHVAHTSESCCGVAVCCSMLQCRARNMRRRVFASALEYAHGMHVDKSVHKGIGEMSKEEG